MPDSDSWVKEALDKIGTTALDDKLKNDLVELVKWAYDDGWDAGAQAASMTPDDPRMQWVRQTEELRRLTKVFSNMETVKVSKQDAQTIIRLMQDQIRSQHGHSDKFTPIPIESTNNDDVA